MRVADLRPLSLFDGLTDDQLAELVDGGTEVRIEPGVDLFREGEHADFWWVLVDGAIDLVRHVGREDTVVATDGRAGSLGRRVPRLGRARRLPRDRPRRGRGRVLRVPADVLRERSSAWFPFGGHLIEGLYRTARSIESTARQRERPRHAGHARGRPRARDQQPGVGGHPGGRRPRDRVPDAALVAATGSPTATSRPRSSPRSTRCAARSSRWPRTRTRLARADREQALAAWLARHGVERDWIIAPPLAAAGVDLDWCDAGRDRPRRDRPSSRGWSGWRARSRWPRCCRR